MRKLFLSLIFVCILLPQSTLFAQDYSHFETDPVILERIDEWQDLKFGFMMHWGMYSQWGVVESWSICNEPWIDRGGVPYNQYVADYRKLNETFNPTNFNPQEWADLAYNAGMRYVVFTTKHHDGFCMFDTKETSYSVSDPSCAYSKDESKDITKDIIEAFRAKGFWTGLYYSKPDWHNSDYWAPEWATPDRSVNYDPALHPERWQRFCDFTFNQIKELTTNYGDIDILWLDGGWVRPEWSLNDEYRAWLGCQGWSQDINMPKIATMAREHNTALIIVDRTVHGKYENYRTPEQLVPDTPLPYPWETCMSMGNSWSYVETDNYKSTAKLISILVDVVAKGGNYLLNVGPAPDGTLPPTAIERMKEIGAWMKVNGIAIYNTRPIYPYCEGNVRYTQTKKGTIYAIYLCEEGKSLPESFTVSNFDDIKTRGAIKILGCKKNAVMKSIDGKATVFIPENVRKTMRGAVTFVIGE